MTHRFVILMLFIVTLTGISPAMLPPDAKAREPQIRARLQQVRNDYEEHQVERQMEAARAREKTQADIFTPPWLRGENGVQSGTDFAAVAAADKARKRNHRIFVSIVLLILISSVAGWVRYATREHDG